MIFRALPLITAYLALILVAWSAFLPLTFDGRFIVTALALLSLLFHFSAE